MLSSPNLFLKPIVLFFLALLFSGYTIIGQTPWHYSLDFHGGKIIKNYPSFPHRNIAFIGEFKLTKPTIGTRPWHQYLHHPDIGGSLFFGSLGNASVFGNLLGIMPIFDFHLAHKTDLSVGLGTAYFKTYFDIAKNPENLFISTPFTYLAKGSLTKTVFVSPKKSATIGISVLHASNGHYKMPNNGINLVLLSMGIHLGKTPAFLPDTFSNRTDRRWHLSLEGGGGRHDFGDGTAPLNGPLYSVATIHIGSSKFIWNSGRFLAGITVTYYTDFYDYIVYQNFMPDTRMNATTLSTYIGYDFVFGHFAFNIESGILWWNPFYIKYKTSVGNHDIINVLKRYINNRLGFRYFPFIRTNHQKGLFLGAYIRANFGQADFNEISIGWLF